ncbi:metallo-beta-lactamase class B [Taibaiella chishuiensis]|uniref:beta-lactamase n=2 Tax=Taibaiella chishuiensis TaxID=1434707 RepID=A0A2P8DAZ9_9BACT|nr:BlaB/IND/MUS family subclass B1 metallo-beta-lactamase [Taibaiella chishuiensis]PSK94361.1 metallo-beta-lactamase class B [Taibaiella chishuiensis]
MPTRMIKTMALLLGISATTLASATENKPALEIKQLTGDFYIFTTYQVYNNQPVPANGMYVVTDKGVVMLDGAWDPTQNQPLLDSIEARHHKKVVLEIGTHYHSDRSGAFDFLRKKGVKTYSSLKTLELCKEFKEHEAEFYFTKDTTFHVGKLEFETYYAGPGHTKDNIVIWFPKAKVLYGGCLIKSADATDLGNVQDANLKQWPETLKKLQQRFPEPAYIIPGHGDWSSRRALIHTLELLQRDKRNRNETGKK